MENILENIFFLYSYCFWTKINRNNGCGVAHLIRLWFRRTWVWFPPRIAIFVGSFHLPSLWQQTAKFILVKLMLTFNILCLLSNINALFKYRPFSSLKMQCLKISFRKLKMLHRPSKFYDNKMTICLEVSNNDRI